MSHGWPGRSRLLSRVPMTPLPGGRMPFSCSIQIYQDTDRGPGCTGTRVHGIAHEHWPLPV